VALDPAFRLAMVAPESAVATGARAAAVLQRYLTGPRWFSRTADLRQLGIREAGQLEVS